MTADAAYLTNFALELSDICLVPELTIDLTTIELKPESYDGFRKCVNESLRLLFIILNKTDNLIFELSTENFLFHCNFTRVLCEQSSLCTLFKTDDESILQNIEKVIKKYFDDCVRRNNDLVTELFSIYKNKLNNNLWKNNIGSVYGFLRFCELLFEDQNIDHEEDSNKLADRYMFMLSVGTNLTEYYDPQYKLIGINLLNVLLDKTNRKVIEKMNIQEVVYTTVSSNIQKVKGIELNIKVWTCLISCLKYSNAAQNPSNWNKIDNLYSELFKKITFESEDDTKLQLIYFLNKLSAIEISDNSLIEKFNEESKISDQTEEMNTCLAELRNFCRKNNSKNSYRWVKHFLSFFILETRILNESSLSNSINAIHLSYLLTIFSIPAEVITNQLKEFTGKIVKNFAEILSHDLHENTMVIYWFIETISIHLKTISPSKMDQGFVKLISDLDKFLEYIHTNLINKKMIL